MYHIPSDSMQCAKKSPCIVIHGHTIIKLYQETHGSISHMSPLQSNAQTSDHHLFSCKGKELNVMLRHEESFA